MIMGDRGGACFWKEGDEMTLFRRTGSAFEEDSQAPPPAEPPSKYRHFLDCLESGAECLCPARDGYLVQCVLDAVLRSSAQGREVAVEMEECRHTPKGAAEG
jgi:predicted dehydrogenase